MKRFLIILLLILLCGCSPHSDAPFATPVPTPSSTPLSTPVPATPTIPPHSELFLPDVSVENVILYFNEVCLDAEFVNGGDPSRLQKWDSPIYYIIMGEPTDSDRLVLESFVAYLNTIYGFPGMFETDDSTADNMRIHFADHDTMVYLMGEEYCGLDGCVTFWYEDDMIYDGIICCRTDLDQMVRNSVIMEEIYNGLGPVQDTSLREDSLIYSGYSTPQDLTDMDRLILKLLYHPDMKCGMNAEECEAVIRALYY